MDSRYARHIKFKKFGTKSQSLLKKSSVVIVGIGALGTVISNLLVRAGIGKITLMDYDNVELANLHRQLLFDESDISRNKALCAATKLTKVNSEVDIKAFPEKLIEENSDRILHSNLVIDCTDNIETRLLVNKFCKQNKIPMLHVAAVEDTGNIIFYENKKKEQACLNCLYNENTPSRKCVDFGVMNTITSAISSMAANIAIKFLSKNKIETELIRFNIWDNTISKIKLKQDKKCPVCFGRKSFSKKTKTSSKIKQDQKDVFEIEGKPLNLQELKTKLEKLDKVYNLGYGLSFKNLLIYSNGRVKIKSKTKQEAEKTYKKYIK
jgi:molybdopterin/thiamine biosynthesis adenylyltransferase